MIPRMMIITDERVRMTYRMFSKINIVVLGLLFLIASLPGIVPLATGADPSLIPSYGKGPVELIVFTDYFCPPCMTIEGDLEPAIKKLLQQGQVKVIFVDIPGHKQTAMYAKYFLFATRGAAGHENAVQARNVLFGLSKQNLAKTEAEIEKAFQEKGVAFKPFDPKPVYGAWNLLMKKHKITDTPTCVLKYSETDVRKFVGSVEIRNGLLPELAAKGKKPRT